MKYDKNVVETHKRMLDTVIRICIDVEPGEPNIIIGRTTMLNDIKELKAYLDKIEPMIWYAESKAWNNGMYAGENGMDPQDMQDEIEEQEAYDEYVNDIPPKQE